MSMKAATATTPPTGTYTSVASSGTSPWDGRFTYDDNTKVIVYTKNSGGPPDRTHNTDNGNAINFTIPDNTPGAARWVLATPGNAGGKSQYNGTMNDGRTKTQQGWTATQT